MTGSGGLSAEQASSQHSQAQAQEGESGRLGNVTDDVPSGDVAIAIVSLVNEAVATSWVEHFSGSDRTYSERKSKVWKRSGIREEDHLVRASPLNDVAPVQVVRIGWVGDSSWLGHQERTRIEGGTGRQITKNQADWRFVVGLRHFWRLSDREDQAIDAGHGTGHWGGGTRSWER